MLKSPNTNRLMERTSSVLDEIESKPCTKLKRGTDREKSSRRLSEVKPFENINKNLQSFLEISPMQKEVLLSHKLRDHAYEYQNPFELKEDNLSRRNYQSFSFWCTFYLPK